MIANDTTSFTGIHKALATIALAITLLCTRFLTHEYEGLAFDAQIYAIQALAKLRPSLAGDLFLQNASQDQFNIFPIFPRLYPWIIDAVGLRPAALLLTTICHLAPLGFMDLGIQARQSEFRVVGDFYVSDFGGLLWLAR